MRLTKILLIFMISTALQTVVSAQQGAQKKQSVTQPRPVFKVEKVSQIFTVLEGKWDWEYLDNSCQGNPFTIGFSDNQKELYLTYEKAKNAEGKPEKKVYTYDLLAVSLFGLRGQIQGEKRLTDEQKPVSWEFILLSKDEFCWHRTDLKPGSCTKKIVRCRD